MSRIPQLTPSYPQNLGIRLGIVTATFPHLGFYNVLDYQGSYVTCIAASNAGHSVLGTENIGIYPIGTHVAYFYIPDSGLGVIIGAIPEKILMPHAYKLEELVPGSAIGHFIDPVLNKIEEGLVELEEFDQYRGAYIDALPGDLAQISQSGAAIFSSPLLVGLKANEFCGVWANYMDSLLRLAGWNFQEWTSGYEKAVHVNWNLVWEYEGHGATIFEQLGFRRSFEPKGSTFWKPDRKPGKSNERLGPLEIAYDNQDRELGIPDDETPKEETSSTTTQEPEQQSDIPEVKIGGRLGKYRLPVHTRQFWGGILAPGGVQFVFSQPDSIEGYRTELTDQDEDGGSTDAIFPRPLVQQGVTHTGNWYVKTTNSILLCKFPWVSAPLRIVDIDEKAGSINRARVELAEKYLYRRDLNNKDKRFTTIRCTSVYDIQNFITNWEAKLGFCVFSDKFEFITESKQAGSQFHQYRNEKPLLKRQRRGASFIFMDPYGDILLENGAGAAIEMIGDTIRISAPGGVYIDGGYQIKLFSNHIINLAEREHNVICGKQHAVFVVRKPNPGEPDRRILTGLKIFVDKSNRGRVLIPRDALAQIYRINAMEIVANDVANLANSDLSNRLKEADFSLLGDDLNPIASATYPVQRWAWHYQEKIGGEYEQSKLVAPERFSVAPSTFTLKSGSKEPEPSTDEDKLLNKEFKDEFDPDTVYPLLVKKGGANDYSI